MSVVRAHWHNNTLLLFVIFLKKEEVVSNLFVFFSVQFVYVLGCIEAR